LRSAKISPRQRWQIPGPAAGVEDFIIQLNKSKVLPEAVRVIRASRHQFGFWAELQTTGEKQSAEHGSAGAMGAGDANRGVGNG
jgi:hypothetical protein